MLGPIARTLITRSTAHSFIAACRGGRLVVVNEGNAGRKLKRSNPIKSTGPPSLPSPPSRAKPRSPFAAFRGIISRNKVLGSPNKKMYDHFSEERKRGGGGRHDTCKLLERLIVLPAFHYHLAREPRRPFSIPITSP